MADFLEMEGSCPNIMAPAGGYTDFFFEPQFSVL